MTACQLVLIEGLHTTIRAGEVHHRCRCHPAGVAHITENEGLETLT